MNATLIGLLFLFSCLLASGQILFKKVANTAETLGSISGLLNLAMNFWFWAALALYGTATLLWIFILQKINLSQAYPFVALGFVIVPVAAHLCFKEPLNPAYFAGVALVLCGLWVITASNPAGVP